MSEVTFEPFQKVLVRNFNDWKWRAAFFSHKEDNLFCAVGTFWEQCIPYEGNEHLLGTTDSPTPSEPEFMFGDHVEVSLDQDYWLKAIYVKKASDGRYYAISWGATNADCYSYCRHADW